jgi:hypothetical protein
MSVLLQQLVSNPQLRPYLYENMALPDPDAARELRQQVMAMVAQYADFFDALLLQADLGNISAHEYDSVWRRFVEHMLSSSSAIREYCLEHPQWYSPELLALARRAVVKA